MATLMKWEKARPEGYYYKVSHLWLQNEDGQIEVCERRQMDEDGQYIDTEENWGRPLIHADHWGEIAWNTDCRGYFSEELGIVAAHISLERRKEIVNKLAKKFRNAVYYCD
jgi:hypothetical protein